MKKYRNLSLILLAFLFVQCFEQTTQVVPFENTEEIEKKLQALRDMQLKLSQSQVNAGNYAIEIQNKIDELNDLIAPGNIPITYSIGIVSAAGSQETIGIADATVSMNVRGERLTATTGTDGQVVFENLRSGIVLVHVSVPGYTDASFVADLRVAPDDDYNAGHSGNAYNVTSAIGLYPTTSGLLAGRISGTLFFDPDRSDDVIDPTAPEYGVVEYFNFDNSVLSDVYAYRPAEKIDFVDNAETNREKPLLDAREQTWETIDQAVNIYAFVEPNPIDFSYVPFGTAGHILLAVYEEMFIVGASDPATGAYNLVIPAGVNGNNVTMTFEEFAGTEQYIRATNLNTATTQTTVTLREREVVFTALYSYISNVPHFPGTFGPGYYNFDDENVNRFTTSISENRARNVNVFFGARTRDE